MKTWTWSAFSTSYTKSTWVDYSWEEYINLQSHCSLYLELTRPHLWIAVQWWEPCPHSFVRALDDTQLLHENKRLHNLGIEFGFPQAYTSNDMILLISCLNVSEASIQVVIRYYTEIELDSGGDAGSVVRNEFTLKENDDFFTELMYQYCYLESEWERNIHHYKLQKM